MALTLGAVTLPDDLIWTDEFDWSPIQQSKAYTLTGALVIETGKMLAGRPITLAGGNDHGWASRATVKALYALLDTDSTMTLTLHDARTFSVKFNHEGQQPVQAKPIIDYNNLADTDHYSLVLKLIAV
jgi:hypothetical protein